MPSYLKRRGDRWYSNIPVPLELRGDIGKFAIVEALGTSSLGEAKERVKDKVRDAFALFAAHRGDAHGAEAWRTAIQAAQHKDERDALEIAASNLADTLPQEEAQRFAAEVFGAVTVASAAEEYFKHADLAASSLETYRQATAEFPALRLDQVTTAKVREHLAKLQRKGLSLTTRRHRLTILRGLWRKFRAIGLTDLPSPFDGIEVLGKADREDNRAFTDDEVIMLAPRLAPMSTDLPDLREYFALALLTGARINELARLWRGTIEPHKDHTLIHIRDAKTKSSNRTLPVVHPLGRAILAKWAKARTKETPKGRASKLLSNRFTTAKKSAKLPKAVNFHSTRRYWTTRAEVLQLDPIGCARYVGHAVKGMTFGLYSKGHHDVLLRVAKGYTLPAKVEKALRGALVSS